MLKDKYKQIIEKVFAKHLEHYELYLFGSRARDDLEESIIPYKIDVLDMDAISNEMLSSISNEGILIQKI